MDFVKAFWSSGEIILLFLIISLSWLRIGGASLIALPGLVLLLSEVDTSREHAIGE